MCNLDADRDVMPICTLVHPQYGAAYVQSAVERTGLHERAPVDPKRAAHRLPTQPQLTFGPSPAAPTGPGTPDLLAPARRIDLREPQEVDHPEVAPSAAPSAASSAAS